jgi:prepilin-type N-terminal cleavage/methylation domain-containing protein
MQSLFTSRTIRGNSGFTMVELIVVVVILTLVVGIGVPTYHLTIKPTAQLNGAARQLYSDFQLARLRAISENIRYGLAFRKTVSGKYYDYVVFKDESPNDNSKYDVGEFVKGTAFSDDYTNVLFDEDSSTSGDGVDFFGTNNSMAMQPDGLPTKNGTAYLMNEKNEGRKIIVNLMGGVRLEKYGSSPD